MKKNLSLILVLVLLISLSVTFADEKVGISEKTKFKVNRTQLIEGAKSFLISASKNQDKFGITNLDVESLYIGRSIPVYKVEKESINFDENIEIKPILEDGKVVAIVTIQQGDDGSLTYIYGKDYSDELNKYVDKNKIKKIALLYRKNDISVISSKEIKKIFEFKSNVNNKKESIINNNYQTKKLEFGLLSNDYRIELNNTALKTLSYPDSMTINIECVEQVYSNDCWAAVVSSIGQHVKGIPYNSEYIANEINVNPNDPVSAVQVKNAYDQVYNISTTLENSQASDSKIVNEIINNKPITAFYLTNDRAVGHSVAVNGYQAHSSAISLTIMDPNYHYYRSSYSNGDNFTIYYPNYGTLEWVMSIYLD